MDQLKLKKQEMINLIISALRHKETYTYSFEESCTYLFNNKFFDDIIILLNIFDELNEYEEKYKIKTMCLNKLDEFKNDTSCNPLQKRKFRNYYNKIKNQ